LVETILHFAFLFYSTILRANSNRLIFFFFLSHHIGKSPFSISTYIEKVLRQIDFPPFLYGKGDAMSFFLLGIGEKLLGIEKK